MPVGSRAMSPERARSPRHLCRGSKPRSPALQRPLAKSQGIEVGRPGVQEGWGCVRTESCV